MDGDHRLKREHPGRRALRQDAVADPDRFDRSRTVDRLDQCTGGEAGGMCIGADKG